MNGVTVWTYARRNLWRQPRRTLLSMLGAGIGCAIGIMSTSWIEGAAGMQQRAIVESGAGHLRIVPAGWLEDNDESLRLSHPERLMDVLQQTSGIKYITPRASFRGLAALGNRSAGVQVTGLVPERERASNRLVKRGSVEGRYLERGDRGVVVIGKGLADRMDLLLGDDLYVTLSSGGEMIGVMFRVAGVLTTGSRELDHAIFQVMLEDVESATGLAGPSSISLVLDDPSRAEALRTELQARLPGDNEVITWKEVSPEFAAGIEGDRAFTRILLAIIFLVVALGIASAQLTAVLERRREFAVLKAVGMPQRRLVGLLFTEAFLLGLGGAVMAMLLGGPVAWLLADKGVNMAGMMGDDLGYSGILLDPVMYGAFGSWIVWHALVISISAMLVATAYPALYAMRTLPAEALRQDG